METVPRGGSREKGPGEGVTLLGHGFRPGVWGGGDHYKDQSDLSLAVLVLLMRCLTKQL